MPDYVKRMIEEHQALKAKIHALRGFINGKNYGSVPEDKKIQMEKQLGFMDSYHDVLNFRIDMELREL